MIASVIPAHRRLKQESHLEFRVSLGYILCFRLVLETRLPSLKSGRKKKGGVGAGGVMMLAKKEEDNFFLSRT